MSETITTTIIGEDGTPLEVQGEYHPGEKGSKDRFGQQIEPNTDPYVVVWRVVNTDGELVELSDVEYEVAEEALLEEANDPES